MTPVLLLHCRSGFENACAAEITARAAESGVFGFARAEPGRGFITYEPYDSGGAGRLMEELDFHSLIFVRQWFVAVLLEALDSRDRVSPMVATLRQMDGAYSDVWVETPDTNEGKQLSRLARQLSPPLRQALKAADLWRPGALEQPRAQILLSSGNRVWVGWASTVNSAPWPMGIPRLRLPRAAPSRAVLKLEEGLVTFLSPEERRAWVREGRTAVDLGAAPGGWTWLLVRNGMSVTAVDNGALLPELARSPLVEHLRVDGLLYHPERPVHWLVCDIVEQPRRIAELAASWYAAGWCQRALFNLKLPMKRRYEEIAICQQRIAKVLETVARPYQLRIRHLYHDREEVTAYLAPPAASRPRHGV